MAPTAPSIVLYTSSPSAPTSTMPDLNRPLAPVIAWNTPESSRLESLCRPSPDSVEMVIIEFSRIDRPLASFCSSSRFRK